jgi:hypothetical protein
LENPCQKEDKSRETKRTPRFLDAAKRTLEFSTIAVTEMSEAWMAEQKAC